ncbi:MAG TPA: segregation/condensation protein A [Syntrophomonas sp.]|nr:segregation/condensation protein A [Syntrophomonas sp.]
MAYVVNLEQFYGPLDLLLYLVEKNEMNIYDISIALITDQYMEFIAGSGFIDLDQIGDFLMMASYLLSLKSRMLLPGATPDEEDAAESDPREDLIHKLIAYKRFKKAAELLATRLNDDYSRAFFRHGQVDLPGSQMEIAASTQTLFRTYLRLIDNNITIAGYEIPMGDVNVAHKMDEIMQRLQTVKTVSFHELCSTVKQRREILANFLAVLELIRLNRVEAVQNRRFGEIKLRVREMRSC